MSWIAIPASAIFLSTYGAGLLPVTYIGAAVAGAASSAALSAALRRRPLVTVALRVLVRHLGRAGGGVGAAGERPPMGLVRAPGAGADRRTRWASCCSWARPGCSSTSAPSRRCTPGSSPGSRSASSPVALAAPPLLELLGGTEHLVLGAAAAGGLWLGLLTVIRHQFRAELSGVDLDEAVDQGRGTDLGRPAAAPVRRPDRRVPDAVRGGEPVARLPRVRARHRALRGQPGPGPVHQPVHGHRLRGRHRVPAPDRRAAPAPVRASLRAHRQPERRPRHRGRGGRAVVAPGIRGHRGVRAHRRRHASPTSCSPTAPPAPR